LISPGDLATRVCSSLSNTDHYFSVLNTN
jgi:hypothetical protein